MWRLFPGLYADGLVANSTWLPYRYSVPLQAFSSSLRLMELPRLSQAVHVHPSHARLVQLVT